MNIAIVAFCWCIGKLLTTLKIRDLHRLVVFGHGSFTSGIVQHATYYNALITLCVLRNRKIVRYEKGQEVRLSIKRKKKYCSFLSLITVKRICIADLWDHWGHEAYSWRFIGCEKASYIWFEVGPSIYSDNTVIFN